VEQKKRNAKHGAGAKGGDRLACLARGYADGGNSQVSKGLQGNVFGPYNAWTDAVAVRVGRMMWGMDKVDRIDKVDEV